MKTLDENTIRMIEEKAHDWIVQNRYDAAPSVDHEVMTWLREMDLFHLLEEFLKLNIKTMSDVIKGVDLRNQKDQTKLLDAVAFYKLKREGKLFIDQ